MRPVISDAQAPLVRAVQRLLVAAFAYDPGRSVTVVVESATSEDWASATYVGQRHRLELRLEPNRGSSGSDQSSPAHDVVARKALTAAVANLGETIGETDIEAPGHFVADIAVVNVGNLESGAFLVTLEALTLLN